MHRWRSHSKSSTKKRWWKDIICFSILLKMQFKSSMSKIRRWRYRISPEGQVYVNLWNVQQMWGSLKHGNGEKFWKPELIEHWNGLCSSQHEFQLFSSVFLGHGSKIFLSLEPGERRLDPIHWNCKPNAIPRHLGSKSLKSLLKCQRHDFKKIFLRNENSFTGVNGKAMFLTDFRVSSSDEIKSDQLPFNISSACVPVAKVTGQL